MDVRTSTLQKYIDAFGESTVIEAIKKAKSRRSPGSIVDITNPIMRFLTNTTYVKNGKLYSYQRPTVPADDYSYTQMTASILADLKPELNANPSYVKQIKEKILNSQSGPMLSGLNEILVANYYKFLGIKVELNSSEQSGAADINLVELPFATDTKTFPNNRLRLEAIVNASAKQIVDAVKLLRNEGIVISVFEPDKKKIQAELVALGKAIEEDTVREFNKVHEAIHVMGMRNNYRGADFHITVKPQNVNVFFQASWDMAPSIEEMKTSVEKAIQQAAVLGKQAIPWIMVPRDANRNGIEVQMLRYVAKFHQFVMDHNEIFIMPVYGLEFEGEGINTIFDVFQTGQNTFNIKAETFQEYIRGLLSRGEFYV